MFSQAVVVGALLLTTKVIASPAADIVFSRSSTLDEKVRREAYGVLEGLDKRRVTPTGTAAGAIPSTTDIDKYNEMAAVGCADVLAEFKGKAHNPSGMAACYNVPFFDQDRGVFESEIRLFNVSEPTGPWVGLTIEDMSIALSYGQAQISATNETLLKRDEDAALSWPVDSLATTMQKRQAVTSEPMKNLTYVGQVNNDVNLDTLNALQMQIVLTPSILLTANNGQLSADLMDPKLAFLSGVFVEMNPVQPGMPNFGDRFPALIQVPMTNLPGKQFKLFPIGLVITSLWLLIGAGTVFYGTYLRYQSRDQYRKSVRAQQTSAQPST